jgi:hypothetical protein
LKQPLHLDRNAPLVDDLAQSACGKVFGFGLVEQRVSFRRGQRGDFSVVRPAQNVPAPRCSESASRSTGLLKRFVFPPENPLRRSLCPVAVLMAAERTTTLFHTAETGSGPASGLSRSSELRDWESC